MANYVKCNSSHSLTENKDVSCDGTLTNFIFKAVVVEYFELISFRFSQNT